MNFLVLDVDNTLIHTLILEHVEESKIRDITNEVKKLYPRAGLITDPVIALVVPRPGLDQFEGFLKDNHSRMQFGIYSTARRAYINMALELACPWILENAEFIWDEQHCLDQKFKSMDMVSGHVRVPVRKIYAIDDLPVVMPEKQRIDIEPFAITSLIKTSTDRELGRVWRMLENLWALKRS